MPDIEFRYRETDELLRFDEDNACFCIRQYDRRGWYVRVLDAGIIPHYKSSGLSRRLVQYRNDPACFVIPDEQINEVVNSVISLAGHLSLWPSGPSSVELKPALYIEPRLSPDDWFELFQRLKRLAEFVHSPVVASQAQRTESKTAQERKSRLRIDADAVLLDASEKFVAMCDALVDNWTLIERTPATEMHLREQMIDVEASNRPLSATAMQRAIQRPGSRRIEVLAPIETKDTSENRFLSYLLAEIHRVSPQIISRLGNREAAHRASRERNKPDNELGLSFYQVYRDRWAKQSNQTGSLVAKLQAMAQSVVQATAKVAPLAQSRVLEEVKVQEFPALPSDRLTKSHDYGPVFHAYIDYEQAAKPLFLPLKLGMEKALQRIVRDPQTDIPIHPVHKLYELWVMVEVYDQLVNGFGFKPTTSSPSHPLMYLDVVDGEPENRDLSGRQFELKFECGHYHIDATLYYDAMIDTARCDDEKRCFDAETCPSLHCYDQIMNKGRWISLRPDVFLEMRYDDELYRFAIDAKYRNYARQANQYLAERAAYPVENVYELDLLGVAKMKYMDALGCTAAFVVHSDFTPGYEFWGGKNWSKLPHREQITKDASYTDHRFGAVPATPSRPRNIERLLECFLMYHMGIHDVCWECQKITEESSDDRVRKYLSERDGQLHERRTGVGSVYQCPGCSRFWVSTWCANPGCDSPRARHGNRNPILKLGLNTFHIRRAGNTWAYDCPYCGKNPERA